LQKQPAARPGEEEFPLRLVGHFSYDFIRTSSFSR
jgi:hypothetical protein